MGKLKLIMVSLIGVCAFQANGQFGYYQDALKYSQTNWLVGSTARMQGLAGTQNSLGGDISSIHSNPAGLGFYNRSSASMTLGLGFQNSDDSFSGLTTPNFNNTFNISNAGMVFNFNKGRFSEDKFKGGSLGISIARVNDFNRQFRYEGESGSSILDLVSNNLQFGNSGELEDAFYDQFLVDQYYTDSDNYDPYDPANFNVSGGVITPNQTGSFQDWGSPIISVPYQQEVVDQRGNQYEIDINWGGNYDDRIYFGGGLGIQTLYFSRERFYTESEFLNGESLDPLINSFQLDDRLVARGAGINTSFGLIVRPVDIITIGVSYQSPTFLTINEESEFTLSTDWGDFDYEDANNDGTIYDLNDIDSYLSTITETKYQLKTPARVNLGATMFIGKSGFISGDVEMVDYANAELQSNDFSPLQDNQVIIDNFQSVINYRVGGEYRLDNIRFRGGYSFNPDPTGGKNNRKYTTFGVGYKTSDFFMDVAVVNTKFKEFYAPYNFGTADLTVDSRVKNTTIAITAGFNF